MSARPEHPAAMADGPKPVSWRTSAPFLACHLIPFLAVFTGVGVADLVLCAALYGGRILFITAGSPASDPHLPRSSNDPGLAAMTAALVGTPGGSTHPAIRCLRRRWHSGTRCSRRPIRPRSSRRQRTGTSWR